MAVDRSNYASFKEYPGPIKRQGPFNIDTSAMYTSRAAALEYAQTNPAAYDGQILTVTETNADGSTALYYFGIKNAAITNADGSTSIEPQLMQIMTLLDSQNLLDRVGAIKYKGTLGVVQESTSFSPEYVHTSFDEIVSEAFVTPEAGDMYNVYFSNSMDSQTVHCYNRLSFMPSSSTAEWSATSDSMCIDSFVTAEIEGETKYGVKLKLGSKLHGMLPPYVPDCWNYIAYTRPEDTTKAHILFYDTYEYGYSVDANNNVYTTLTLIFKDGQDAIDALDGWAISHVSLPAGATSMEPLFAKAEDAYNQLKAADESNEIVSTMMAFASLLRNGDNIIYNGYFWDVLSGMVDLTPYATKDELTTSLSNSTSIYRQE